MITEAKLKIVLLEIDRFKLRVQELRKRCDKDAEYKRMMQYGYGQSKESGAVKRTSLDLTRALVELRRSN